MERLCRITVPGLSIKSDFTAVRRRMLADFPNVHEVVATTAPGTLLLIYSGPDEVDAWYGAVLDTVASRETRSARSRASGLGGGGSAA